MPDPRKRILFLHEVLQSFPSSFFLYAEPFFVRERFQGEAGKNGLSQALVGASIACGSYMGGRMTHRTHPRHAMLFALASALCAALFGMLVGRHHPVTFCITLSWFAFSQAYYWPSVETAIMDKEPMGRVQHFAGVYNLVWSLGTATAFLCATPFMAYWGIDVVFAIPVLFCSLNLLLLLLNTRGERFPTPVPQNADETQAERELREEQKRLSAADRDAFRWLAWIANTFGYLSINVVVTYSPLIQSRLGFSLAEASVWCSLWFYVRVVAFEVLRRWSGWHYRKSLLLGGFVMTALSFILFALAPTRPLLLLAQLVYGFGAGLLYQASLFYSMAESEASGEHGGIHEALIGIGTMSGPLIIFACAQIAPQNANLPILCVLLCMVSGFGGLLRTSKRIRSIAHVSAAKPSPNG
jgi:predicted MFS family arabinose efflux permease